MMSRAERNIERKGALTRGIGALCTLVLALALALPQAALAEVRGDDIVGYRTVQSAGIADADSPSISAKYAYVADDEGNVYFQRDAESQTNIASITKVMTAAVALEAAGEDFTVTVSQRAAAIGESTAQLQAGDELTLRDAIVGLMIPSGNDAACAIAESVGELFLLDGGGGDNDETTGAEAGDSNEPSDAETSTSDEDAATSRAEAAYNAFVDKMNSTAAEIGCTSTLFTNPHGLDIDEFAQEMHSTAKDVATFCEYAMESQTFREVVAGGDSTITVKRADANVQIELASTDLLIGNYEGACGIKTGYTDAAGSCFAGACERDGRYLYAIVLGSPDNDQRFTDAREIFDWVYDSQVELAIANSTETTSMATQDGYDEVPVIAHVTHTDWTDKRFPVTLSNPDATIQVSSIFGNVSQEVIIEASSGSIAAGDVVGRIDLYQHNELFGSESLVACEGVEAPNILERISIALQRIFDKDASKSASVEMVNEMPILIEKV